MNSDIAEGKWRQLKGSVKAKWGKLTDDDIQQVDGNLDKFIGKMQERYGMSRDEAEKEFNRIQD
ncbi:general stress protein CsbD [Arsukibacterium sp. MJ3]|uniref:CsbD family protein n=1 Tax=Arsukibacterium sp. MJ3 TaxID=1632859 RepID=UPI000626EDF9|nr:CsbD family protein [Arsukibacterium sp. MJ3]KKO49916.1 general stress protein CsbD [Arsukibacterium sp. MJ3]